MVNFKARVPRFRKLRRLGADPARIVGAGGKASIVYRQSVTGVSNHLLHSWRTTVAKAVAPRHGTGREQLDIALMQADSSAKGSADPAFDAHLIPIVDWARAAWEERVPRSTLMAMASPSPVKVGPGEERVG